MTYSTYQGQPVYDYYIHAPATTDYPAGRGQATTTLAEGIAPVGKRVLLHMITPANGFTPGTFINILHGDGSTLYFAFPIPSNANGTTASIDIVLNNGLSTSGGASAGSGFIIAYRILD